MQCALRLVRLSLLVATSALLSADWSYAQAPQPHAPPDPASSAADSAPPISDRDFERDHVRPLLRDLRSGRLEERETAENRLVELGTRLLDFLPELTETTPPELRQRLVRVRDKLEKAAAAEAALASPITLQGEMTLTEAIERIHQQGPNRLFDYRRQLSQEESNPTLTLDLQDVPFWKAVDELLEAASLTTYNYAELDEPGLALAARPASETPLAERKITYSGPFRIEVTDVVASRSPRNILARQLRLTLRLSWEPRLRVLSTATPLESIIAVDDRGQELKSTIAGTKGENVAPGATASEVELTIELPDRAAASLASIRGRFDVLAPGHVETFRFRGDDLTAGRRVERRRAELSALLDRVRKNNDAWEVRLGVRFDESRGAMESYQALWAINNETFLESPAGERISHDLHELVRTVGDEILVAYYYDLPGPISQYTLVYKSPSIIMNLPVEFEIQDVELP